MTSTPRPNVLASLALAATMFVHFKDPRTDEPVFLPNEKTGEPDETKPVGVRIYGPGSKEYRTAQTAITNEAIERKRRKVTAELIQKNAVELLARTTYEFVNFEYQDTGATLENNRAFYLDDTFAHLKEQVQEKMGDFGAFLS